MTAQPGSAQWLAGKIPAGGASDISACVAGLIRSGQLAHGTRLPTVRELAGQLQVSPGKVVTAWSGLRLQGLIETHRRGGTVVSHRTPTDRAPREFAGWHAIDFARDAADPVLQPDLSEALMAGLLGQHVNAVGHDHLIAPLRAVAESTWPFQPEELTTVGGATEGILLALKAIATPSACVAIEEPTSPRLLKVLELLGLEAVPVGCDAEGPLPSALKAALARKPVAFLYQPRAHYPLGHTVSSRRLGLLMQELQATPQTYIVEDDYLGPLAVGNALSLGSVLPQRTILVRAYCKAYGLDLRTALVGSTRVLVARIRSLRSHGVAMTSRILQGALAHQLSQPKVDKQVAKARERYAARRQMLVQALRERGLSPAPDSEALVLWLPVAHEASAIVALAKHGIFVCGGRECHVSAPRQGWLRVSITHLPDDAKRVDELADLIAQAVSGNQGDDYE